MLLYKLNKVAFFSLDFTNIKIYCILIIENGGDKRWIDPIIEIVT